MAVYIVLGLMVGQLIALITITGLLAEILEKIKKQSEIQERK